MKAVQASLCCDARCQKTADKATPSPSNMPPHNSKSSHKQAKPARSWQCYRAWIVLDLAPLRVSCWVRPCLQPKSRKKTEKEQAPTQTQIQPALVMPAAELRSQAAGSSARSAALLTSLAHLILSRLAPAMSHEVCRSPAGCCQEAS